MSIRNANRTVGEKENEADESTKECHVGVCVQDLLSDLRMYRRLLCCTCLTQWPQRHSQAQVLPGGVSLVKKLVGPAGVGRAGNAAVGDEGRLGSGDSGTGAVECIAGCTMHLPTTLHGES